VAVNLAGELPQMRKLLIAVLFASVLPSAALAQANLEGRVGKLESEMRAVQRKVFPGGAGQLILPDVETQAPQTTPPGTPASGALVDLTARVTSLEGQLATLTGQAEQNQFQLRRLQEQFDAYKRANDARVKAVETPPLGAPARAPDTDEAEAPRTADTRPATTPARPAATPARSDPGRADRVAAVAKPSSGDAPEDEYLYGYRLWAAKLYPEAATQLKKVADTYPKHRRASYARNLLGRAYLDDGKPSLASVTFYDNYKTLPDGERAPESLFYLAQALQTLKKPADACKVYGELTDVYGAKIGAGMKADIARGRAAAKCE
jgi:TolA-binding protein